jgi:hypothetical protein
MGREFMTMDRTIQLKKFKDEDDEPFEWLEWRGMNKKTFEAIKALLVISCGRPMDRSGD